MIEMLVYAPQYRPNLSSIIRTAVFFGLHRLYIFDKHQLMVAKNSKERSDLNHMAKVWTAGAIDHLELIQPSNVLEFLYTFPGRVIGTILNSTASDFSNFKFASDDLIILGNEKEGLPQEIVEKCTELITLPSAGSVDCLNVAVSAGIFLYEATKQTTPVQQ